MSEPVAVKDCSSIEVRVVVADPATWDEVSTRILVDGNPVIAAAFDKGPAFPPEALLAGGRLHATSEEHEVRLAEAYCTEGCCGALYVTIGRDGGTVVWRDWRGHTSTAPPPELRFDAARYDAEIARAAADRGWEWPARTVARLVRDQWRERPDTLTRWQCHQPGICARPGERDTMRILFSYPEAPRWPSENPWLQFQRIVAIDDAPPAEQAANVIRELEAADPKSSAAVVGGSAESARRLGYPWPPATR